MERVKRRLWTMATIALAGVVIAATLVSGLFQTAVYMLPNYRDDLSVWVTQVAGRPVQVGGISLVWRGASPRLDLSDITLFNEDGTEEALSAQRLSLGISLWRLLTGDLRPSRIELSGLSLAMRADEQGQLSLIGFDTGTDFSREDAEKWLRQLENFRQLRLENCELAVELPDRSTLRFGLRTFDAARTLGGFDAEGELRLPVNYGEELRFEAEVSGDIGQPAGWTGELSGSASGLLPQPWLRGLTAPGTAAGVDAMEASFEGRIAGGRLAQLTLALSADNFVVTRAGEALSVESLRAEVMAARLSQGWRLELTQLQFDDEDQIQGSLHYVAAAAGYELAVQAARVRLGRLAPYLRYLRELPAQAAPFAGLGGELSSLALKLSHGADGDRYSVQTQLEGVSLPAGRRSAGLSALNGRISATEEGGSLQLVPGPISLNLPLLVTPELPFTTLSGTLAWVREDSGWRLSMPKLGWQLAGSSGNGQFSLRLPSDAAQSPVLDLSANFSIADANQLKPWMPRHWSEGLQGWLRRSIVAARVPAGQIVIRGPLRRFPFLEAGSGEWKLDLSVADARLDYAPGWPQLEQLQAQLAFRGNGLRVESKSGQLAGSSVDGITAHIADFRDHQLTVDGDISGQTASLYQILRSSPLAQRLGGLLGSTQAAGPAKVGLHLDIPLIKGQEPKARGTVTLDGVQMYYRGLQEPITDIRGTLAFDHDGVTAEKLGAHFSDVGFDARIEARAGTRGVVVTEFPYTINADGEGLSSFVPELVRRNLGGETRLRVELPLGVEGGGLQVSSNLKGIDVRLPPPLAKTAAEPANIQVVVGADAAAPVRVTVDYENRLGANIMLQPQEAGGLRAAGINLRLGSGAPPAPAVADLRVRGQVAELDVAAWGAALKGADVRGLALKEADLSAARWNYQGQVVQDVRAQFTPAAEGWELKLEGTGAEGTALYRKSDGGRLGVQLSKLTLELPAPQTAGTAAAVEAPMPALDPNEWPVLDLNIGLLNLNGSNFGALQLGSSRLAGRGQKLEAFKLGGGVLDAGASGEWLREAGQSSAKLKFAATSTDFTAVLKSFGFAQNLSAKQARLDGELGWDPAAGGVDWEQSRGHIDLVFENGTLKAVEPGAGRVLGLLNFYALPRRLLLDFRDVISSGLGFDRISGGFDLGGGSALTDNVSILAPSLRMELRGRVGLAARDYDQRVTVYPDVLPGVTIGAALLGGPAVAALAFIAQQVLDKPLDQVTQFSYQVTGSWENPQVKRIDSATPPPGGPQRPRN